MKFGEVPVAEAEGAILAHSLKLGTTALKKAPGAVGSRSRADRRRGLVADHRRPARTRRCRRGRGGATGGAAAVGPRVSAAAPFTGRANLFAEARGLLVFDRERVDRLNLVDEAITLGTLPPFTVVEPRQMVATIKIIPFAAPEEAVKRCVEAAVGGRPAAARRAVPAAARSG